MKLGVRIVSGLLLGLGIGLIGVVSGAERTDTPAVKENPRPVKAESSRDIPVQEDAATTTESTVMTEQESSEIYQAFRGRVGDGVQPAVQLQSVETAGGTLSILETGDGVVHVVAFAMDRGNPDLEKVNRGVAFSAIITADGVVEVSKDVDQLSWFVGKGKQSSDGGVARVTPEVVVGPCTVIGSATCCVVATDTKYCSCCAFTDGSATPVCRCTPLAAL